MADVNEIVTLMRNNPAGIRFADLCKVCDYYFGRPRQASSSHRVYKTPWPGDPRVNIQNSKGRTKTYQVWQVLKAIERKELEHENSKR
ncbi:MAG: toxin HicA [Nitrospirae bacterium GWC2_42_7]|nr:MAG: toxin HicA [Nitrospirae bacterium GWC2_42_7]